jgi:hypothetical protein
MEAVTCSSVSGVWAATESDEATRIPTVREFFITTPP